MKAPAKPVSMPPPVGGWDTRNALADMPMQNAVILDDLLIANDQPNGRVMVSADIFGGGRHFDGTPTINTSPSINVL